MRSNEHITKEHEEARRQRLARTQKLSHKELLSRWRVLSNQRARFWQLGEEFPKDLEYELAQVRADLNQWNTYTEL